MNAMNEIIPQTEQNKQEQTENQTETKGETKTTPSGGATQFEEQNTTQKEKSPYALYTILAIIVAVFLVIPIALLKRPKAAKDTLKDYIDTSRKNKVSDSEIKDQLLKVGWKEDQINRYFK